MLKIRFFQLPAFFDCLFGDESILRDVVKILPAELVALWRQIDVKFGNLEGKLLRMLTFY